jgi:hypothetical protein
LCVLGLFLALLAIGIFPTFANGINAKSSSSLSDDEKREKAKKFVDEVNQKNGGKWKAAYNERFALMDEEEKGKLAGAIIHPSRRLQLNTSELSATKPSNWESRRCRLAPFEQTILL